MAATVTIRRWTGASGSPTRTDITSANTVANAVDTHQATASGSTNPIKIPAAGTNRSFWVATRLSVDVAPSGTIDNIRWHGDGSANFGTGVGAVAAKASGYVQATGMTGTTGDALNTTNYGTTLTTAAPPDFTMYTSGAPLTVTGSTTTTDTALGELVVYQLTVATTASAGTTAQETFTWLFDET
jgi:hypothetical protein